MRGKAVAVDMRNVRLKVVVVSIVILAGPLNPHSAGYATSWRVASGNWSDGGNWSDREPNCSGPYGVPALIENGGTAQITQTGECCGVLALGDSFGSSGYVLMTSGDLWANQEFIGESGHGTFIQTGGKNSANNDEWLGNLVLGREPGSEGLYRLSGGELWGSEIIGLSGQGTFVQTGGKNFASGLSLGFNVGSEGRYELTGGGELSATGIIIGSLGKGTFVQNGGSVLLPNSYMEVLQGQYELIAGELSAIWENIIPGNSRGTFIQTGGENTINMSLVVGHSLGGEASYQMNGGTLKAHQILLGLTGRGCGRPIVPCGGGGAFVQASGNVSVDTYLLLGLGLSDGGEPMYRLNGGTLNVGGDIVIGYNGDGRSSFVVDGGTINGTTDDAQLCVCGSRGSLSGPCNFNIKVVYKSDEIYGTDANHSVDVNFAPNCLKVGGAYNVKQLTPADFAGGNVSNLLESSVFDVSFDGSFCGEFTITIPYNHAEVDALGVDETSLVILHETGPETYERLDDITVYYHPSHTGVSAKAHTFGKFAVAKGKEFMITFDDGPVPPNTKNIVDALKNVKVANGEPVRAGFFMVGCDSSCEDTGAPRPLLGWLAPWPFEWCRTKGSVLGNSEIVKYVDAAGHIIGNHTQHHMWFWWPSVDEQDVNAEITACNIELESALSEVGKIPPKIFRPPYFVDNPDVRKGAGEYQIIMGTGDDEDSATGDLGLCPFFPPSVSTVERNAAKLVRTWDRDYPCVLTFHDISPTTANNIAEIIRYLREDEGFTLVHFDPNRLPGSIPSLVHHETNTIHQSETVPHIVSLDSTVSTATFNVSWEGSDLDLVLYKPDGTKIDPNMVLVDPNIEYAERETYEYYTISDPNPGIWVMEVSGVNVPPDGEKYAIRVEADTNLALFAFTDKPDYGLNEHISISAQLVNDENSVSAASVTAKVQRLDGSVDNLALYDDGAHGDEDPNDGFYANAYDNTSLRGSHEITVSAIGKLTGEQYERASSLTVMVGSIIYGNVDFGAYAIFADHWLAQNCTEPAWCETADLDQSGQVDVFDLGALAEYWLEGTTP